MALCVRSLRLFVKFVRYVCQKKIFSQKECSDQKTYLAKVDGSTQKPRGRQFQDLFDNIIDQFIEEEIIEVDQYEQANDGGYRGGPAHRNK